MQLQCAKTIEHSGFLPKKTLKKRRSVEKPGKKERVSKKPGKRVRVSKKSLEKERVSMSILAGGSVFTPGGNKSSQCQCCIAGRVMMINWEFF